MSHKSTNAPDTRILAPGLTEQERRFIELCIRAEPVILEGARRKKRLLQQLQDQFGWAERETKPILRRLIARQFLFNWSNGKSVSFAREQVKQARCAYCGCMARGRRLTKDHVIPLSRGGADDESNIVDRCHDCNQAKRDLTPVEWAIRILDYNKPPHLQNRLPWRYRFRLTAATVTSFFFGEGVIR